MPANLKGKNLEGDEMATTCGKVILNEIEQKLRNRMAYAYQNIK